MSKARAGWQDASARTRKPSSWRPLLGIETRSKGRPMSAGVACDSSPGLSVFFSKELHGLPSAASVVVGRVAIAMRRIDTNRQSLIAFLLRYAYHHLQTLSRVVKLSRA